MVFSRFISFSLGVLSGIYITQNYNDVPNVREVGLYYWGRLRHIEEQRRRRVEGIDEDDVER